MAGGPDAVSLQTRLLSESGARRAVNMGDFSAALRQIQRQVHPNLSAGADAVEYIENLVTRLLGMLCQRKPHTVQDVVDQVSKTFPNPIDKWAIQDALQALDESETKNAKKGSTLPADKVHPLLKEMLGYKLDQKVLLYITAVLEYVVADIWKLAGIYVSNIRQHEITSQDVKIAMSVDRVLTNLFFPGNSDTIQTKASAPEYPKLMQPSVSYDDFVKGIILAEVQYIRELSMIIKVFRTPFAEVLPGSKDLDVVFSNILDIHEFAVDLIGSLEDVLEVTEKNGIPLVGTCFEEMAEAAEFDVYEKYIEDMMKPGLRDQLNALLQREDISAKLQGIANCFKDIVKYVLPTLLLGPISHLQHYFEVIRVLREISPDAGDRACLMQAEGLLHPLRHAVDRKMALVTSSFGDTVTRLSPSELWRHGCRLGADRQDTRQLLENLQNSIEGWNGEPLNQCCKTYVMEGDLTRHHNKKVMERYVFLLDGLLILCKRKICKSTSTQQAYRLKEKISIRHIDVVDREDSKELRCSFELRVRNTVVAIFSARTVEEKSTWMAALLFLLSRSKLESTLSVILSEEERIHLQPHTSSPLNFAIENPNDRLHLAVDQVCSAVAPAIFSTSLSSREAEDAQNATTEGDKPSTVASKGDSNGKRSRRFTRAIEAGICGMPVHKFSHLLVRPPSASVFRALIEPVSTEY